MNKDDIKYVDLDIEPMDEKNYEYAYCDCGLPLNHVIRIQRPEHTQYISFNCPNCGRSLGVLAKGIEKHRSTLTSLVKANYQIAKKTGDWNNKELIKNLTKLVMEQEKEIRRLQRS